MQPLQLGSHAFRGEAAATRPGEGPGTGPSRPGIPQRRLGIPDVEGGAAGAAAIGGDSEERRPPILLLLCQLKCLLKMLKW